MLRGVERVRPWVPAAFFFGGFVLDAVTLGQRVRTADLILLSGYLAAAAVLLVLIGRGVAFRGSQYLVAVLQLLFGSVFSALLIFYFLSSSGFAAWLVVLGLGGLLVANEFVHGRYSRLTLSWTFFTLGAVMFFNFALAHLFRSISTFWFYLGTLVAILVVVALWRASRDEAASIAPSLVVAGVLVALHFANAIPPVPLVKKQMLIAHELRRSGRTYTAAVEPEGWRIWRDSSPVFHRTAGERVYCFTSVFVPRGISTVIRHRWERWDERSGEWVGAGVVPFRIEGGRETGYRGYTFKANVRPGRWRVTAESESGAAIGIVEFRIEDGPPPRLIQVRL